MVEQDRMSFEAIMQGLAENFSATLSTNGIAMRFEALRKFSIEQVRDAALAMVATQKFKAMPTIADFVEYFQGGSADDIAQYQASIVWDAVKKYGGNRTVCFDDPITQAVIVRAFGGWQKMCSELQVDQQKWFIKDFVKAYGAFARQGIKEFGALPGRCDPFKTSGPALIGNQTKALLVLQAAERLPALSYQE